MKNYRIVKAEYGFIVEKRFLFLFWELVDYKGCVEDAELCIHNLKNPQPKLKKEIICYR